MKASSGLSTSPHKIFYFLLNIVRIAIGWHFLYEGLAKLFAPGWTSAAYLADARGFMAPFYHWIADSPGLVSTADFLNVWGLIAIGLGLFLGVLPRVSASAGVLLLALYYFAYLPFGSLDYGVPNEGSYLIVNKNLIEMIMLLIIAFAPTERLWGLGRLWKNRHRPQSIGAPTTTAGAGRRELLKNLSALPLLGVFGWLVAKDRQNEVDGISGATIKVSDSSLKDLKGELPKGNLGDHQISRLIMGGNLIGGWAHARDLIYASTLFKAYNSERKVFETLLLGEKAGINAINITTGMYPMINKYKKIYGSNLKTICQVYPTEADPLAAVNEAIDGGVDIVQVQGGAVDFCVRDGKIDIIEKCMRHAKDQGYTTGIGAHDVQSLIACENYGLQPDFIMKTMHHDRYWSAHPRENRYPFQVVAQYSPNHDEYHDNMFCLFPEQTNEYIQKTGIPVIGFKVLAGGAIQPEDGFQYAFDNGADFICVGMFDFQIVDDVNIAIAAIEKANRKRDWWA
jgi:uncharacterized membrane protein YphA (DoxX/SURF4 family)